MGKTGGRSQGQISNKIHSDGKWSFIIFAIILVLIVISLTNLASARADTDEAVKTCMACLYKRSNWGYFRNEAAAWVVKDSRGYSCNYWPMTFENLKITWKGVIPPYMVALIHTHPNNSDYKPSQQDQRVAAHLKVPNYVVSNRGVWVAIPKSETETKLKQLHNSSELHDMLKLLNKANCPDKFPQDLFVDSDVDGTDDGHHL